MPMLSIIPAKAVADPMVTDTQVRVLCAIGTYTNRLGGNVWASVNTLAKSCNLSPRTIQRALPALLSAGYLRVVVRPGRTNLYEVVLDGPPSGVTQGGDLPVTPPPSGESPKREEERSPQRNKRKATTHLWMDPHFMSTMDIIWRTYPKRPEPYSYMAARHAIGELVDAGASQQRLIQSAVQYAQYVLRTATDPKYTKGIVAFYRDGFWEQYTVATVHGRTREEWARSGQDVAEFDRLVGVA